MKAVKLFAYLLVVISTSLFTRCTPENLNYGSTTKEALIKSQWSVDYFFSGRDLTTQFSNYKLSFVGNGTVSASDGATSVNGTWSMITDLNHNDVLRINMSEAQLQGLNDEWTVRQTSDDELNMKGSASEIRLKKN